MAVDPKRKIGPNLKKLMVHFMAVDAIPAGGGLQAAVDLIMSPNGLRDSAMRSLAQALAAVDAMRAAPDNPYGDDEEVIAGEFVKQIEERKAAQALALKKK
jgi:hypothetical protein